MNTNEVRTTDPVWTQYVQGYGHPMFAGDVLFPRAPVSVRKGRVTKFGRDGFRLSNTKRAPGVDMRSRIYTYDSVTYTLDDHGEILLIPQEHIEEGAAMPGLDLVEANMGQFMLSQMLRHEKDCADLATTSTNYPAAHRITPSNKWDTANGNPVRDIQTGSNLVRRAIGLPINTLVFGETALKVTRENDRVREQFKYTSPDSITEEMLARLFRVDRVVEAAAVYDDAGGTTTDLWTTDSVIGAYVDPGGLLPADMTPPNAQRGGAAEAVSAGRGQPFYSRRKPSYGYTYQLRGYPIITGQFYNRKNNSWEYPFIWPRKPFHTFVNSSDEIIAGCIFLTVDT